MLLRGLRCDGNGQLNATGRDPRVDCIDFDVVARQLPGEMYWALHVAWQYLYPTDPQVQNVRRFNTISQHITAISENTPYQSLSAIETMGCCNICCKGFLLHTRHMSISQKATAVGFYTWRCATTESFVGPGDGRGCYIIEDVGSQ